jgi:hypothetical protein
VRSTSRPEELGLSFLISPAVYRHRATEVIHMSLFRALSYCTSFERTAFPRRGLHIVAEDLYELGCLEEEWGSQRRKEEGSWEQ